MRLGSAKPRRPARADNLLTNSGSLLPLAGALPSRWAKSRVNPPTDSRMGEFERFPRSPLRIRPGWRRSGAVGEVGDTASSSRAVDWYMAPDGLVVRWGHLLLAGHRAGLARPSSSSLH